MSDTNHEHIIAYDIELCPDCGGTMLPPAVAGVERGTCHCDKPGRIWGQLFYGTDRSTNRKYGVTWGGEDLDVEPPTLARAVEVLKELRAQWRAEHGAWGPNQSNENPNRRIFRK